MKYILFFLAALMLFLLFVILKDKGYDPKLYEDNEMQYIPTADELWEQKIEKGKDKG